MLPGRFAHDVGNDEAREGTLLPEVIHVADVGDLARRETHFFHGALQLEVGGSATMPYGRLGLFEMGII